MEQLVLTRKHLAELNAIIGEIPHKHAMVMINFIQRCARDQVVTKKVEDDKPEKAEGEAAQS